MDMAKLPCHMSTTTTTKKKQTLIKVEFVKERSTISGYNQSLIQVRKVDFSQVASHNFLLCKTGLGIALLTVTGIK